MTNRGPGEAILSAQSLRKSYSAQPILDDVSLTLHEGDRIGLIGRNGSGKSTLLRIMAGIDLPDEGRVTRRRGLRIALLSQDSPHETSLSVGQVLTRACKDIRALRDEYDELAKSLAHDTPETAAHAARQQRFEILHHELDVTDGWQLETEMKRVASELDLADNDRSLESLSGGELRRVDLAATLLSRPDVLLLDEPTNHIDTKSAAWIESFLVGYRQSCILVTHDRYFLERVVSRIVEIDGTRLISFPGNYTLFLERKAQMLAVEASTERSRRALLRRELEWIRTGPKARTTKQKARIKRFETVQSEEGPRVSADAVFEIPEPPRLSKRILDVDKVSFAYGDLLLFDRLSFILQDGMRVGILGPNGCGKTTLLRVLMGLEPCRSGKITVGEATQFLYVDQSHEEVKPDETVLDFVSGGAQHYEVNGKRMYVPAYLERFLFDMETVRVPMSNLSGGERNRVLLAKKLLQGGNVLVLDEPTNDLDLPTLRTLEEAVLRFKGCAFIVSHDRFFLNRLCTHLIVFEDGGHVLFLVGNYEDYLAYQRRLPEGENETKAKKAPRATPSPARKGKGLSYREQRELQGLEGAIEEAENEVALLQQKIAGPGFYEGPYEEVQKVLAALDGATEEVEVLYARWEELESIQDVKQ